MTTRHPTARRVHRAPAAPDDAFVAGVLETSAWAKKHQRTLIIAAVVAAALIVGLVLYLSNRATTRTAAADELVRVRAVVMTGNAPLAIRDLEQFIARYSGTPAAPEARLYLGRAYLEAGQPQQALDAVRPVMRDLRDDLGVNAAMLAGAAWEALQEPHRAEEIYLRVADDARFLYQRQDGFDHAARIRIQRGDAAGAVELYQRALAATPEAHQDRQVLELRLGEAQALAASPQGAQPQPPPAAPAAGAPLPGQPAPAQQAPGTTPPQPAPTEPQGQQPAAPTGG